MTVNINWYLNLDIEKLKKLYRILEIFGIGEHN